MRCAVPVAAAVDRVAESTVLQVAQEVTGMYSS